ncbi:hypothetical protein GCK32_011898, partial [Trichostrongylus colubriformis]
FPAFVYLFLNRTIQREALMMLGIRRPSNLLRPLGATTTNAPQRASAYDI